MPKVTKQLPQPELHQQSPQMPSARMETQSQQRVWLLTGVLLLVLIVMVVASQAGKSTQTTKTPTQVIQLAGAHASSWHDTDHVLTVAPAPSWHDTDHVLTIDPAPSWHDTDHVLTVSP